MKNPITFLRHVGFAEAVSFLILVFIAMPLKHFAGMPMAVKGFGWIHGILFIAYLYALARATFMADWPFGRALLFFVAALVPFGPFLVDRRARQYEADFEKHSATPL